MGANVILPLCGKPCPVCHGARRLPDGRAERAEFVRVQCELARCPGCTVEGVRRWQTIRACRDVLFPEPHDGKGQGPHCAPCRQFVRLRRRERELLEANEGRWLDWLVQAWGAEWVPVRDCDLSWRRGFVEAVTCTTADWMAHGAAIVQAQPITEVRLSDKRPWHSPFTGRYAWFFIKVEASAPHCLPWQLQGSEAKVVMIFPTEADALAALSAACLAFARKVSVSDRNKAAAAEKSLVFPV